MQKDVILVTISYRLCAFGFLSLKDDPSLNIPGNAGLKDQTFALKWIKRNIENFGGDPSNVTLFGESAGGLAVHLHAISNHSKGLFHRAIAMSGCALSKIWATIPDRNWAHKLAVMLGWDGIGGENQILIFLEEANEFDLINAQFELTNECLEDENVRLKRSGEREVSNLA